MNNVRGETHRLDDPYTPTVKYQPPEPPMYKGKANHVHQFSKFYKQNRTLDTRF